MAILNKLLSNHYVQLFLLLLFPLLALLRPGLPLTHDGQDHVARIANFYQSLSDGNIIPRWAGNLNWGYGHPVLMFLYPLPSYVASIFHIIGINLVDSTKLVFGLSFIASGLFMYLFVAKAWGKMTGFIAALLYNFAPYRFVDLYIRGAIGEHVAFIWPPLICFFLFKLSGINISNVNSHPQRIMYQVSSIKQKKSIIFHGLGLALSVVFLILSHNALAIMFLAVIFLYFLYLLFIKKKQKFWFLITSFTSLMIGFILSCFYWFPAVFEGKYTLRDIVTQGEFADRFSSFYSFIYSPWNYGGSAEFSKQIGLVHWIGIILLLYFLVKKKFKFSQTALYIGCLAVLVLTLFLMTPISTFVWNSVSILQKFQFPWRFLSVTVFVSAFLAASGFFHAIQIITDRYQLKEKYTIFVLSFLILALTYTMWQPKGYLIKPESFYTYVYNGTTDTGESSPIWSVRFMERRPAVPAFVAQGHAAIRLLQKTTTERDYEIKSESKTRIVENTLYFPGWRVYVDGYPVSVEFQDPTYRGLITYWLESGSHVVNLRFTDTKIRRLADDVSLTGLVVLFIIGMYVWRLKT
ncbi:hypothetical protein A2154_01525 [Candidatus Gottesmanbacteria bacterium RBG_16_43_7]|uniref:Membrane protein 6-pyruvoyl-tetrahydropterin synthase-related domain-containing protein n=1 Tax=Candidatus Gottesmanbacteria bacterium RBG_16_43_7 TaxID=1798373 RepID=A0A1F5Z7E7_9BACT|nr:MAG: hypothetical protein A2154_01525 [Candidatus Gottesmanbacteria bacterium RBG_16_43_7]